MIPRKESAAIDINSLIESILKQATCPLTSNEQSLLMWIHKRYLFKTDHIVDLSDGDTWGNNITTRIKF